MKILLCAPYNCQTGGISRWTSHIVNYYKSLKKSDVVLIVSAMNRNTDMAKTSSVWVRLKAGISEYMSLYKKFKTDIKTSNPDVVHITSSASLGLFKDILFLRYLKRRNIPSIIHFRFGRIPELFKLNNWEWKLLCMVIKLTNRTIVIDKASYNTLVQYGFQNISLLPNPVADYVIEFSQSHSIQREQNYLYYAGHGLRTKGVYELVEACKTIPDIKLKMAGTIADTVKADLQALAGSSDWLEIVGNDTYDNVLLDMKKCDLFILPTYTEGFPNVILEAMACGCAIITTKVGAIPEMLESDSNGKFGILIEPKNVEQLRSAIFSALNNQKLKDEMRLNVEKRVRERYNISSVWNQMNEIWNSLQFEIN